MLTALDRCDRCGAQAYVEALPPSGRSPLLFCGHHARVVTPALETQGFAVVDHREQVSA